MPDIKFKETSKISEEERNKIRDSILFLISQFPEVNNDITYLYRYILNHYLKQNPEMKSTQSFLSHPRIPDFGTFMNIYFECIAVEVEA